MSIGERVLASRQRLMEAKTKSESNSALVEFGNAFLDALYFVTDGKLWTKNQWFTTKFVTPENVDSSNINFFSLVPIPGEKSGNPNNMAIITITSTSSSNPELCAHVILESRMKDNGGHLVENFIYVTRKGSRFDESSKVFDVMSEAATFFINYQKEK